MDQIDQTLTELDPTTARRLRPVLAWLFGSPGDRMAVSAMNQLDLQTLLWRRLDRSWAADEAQHHEVAWALGDFFDAVGLDRYAAVCRSQRTHEIISAWHTDPDEATRLSRAAQEASGVRPPATEELAFAEPMGSAEAIVQAELSATLERLIAAGELDPAARGYKRRATQVAETFLRTPSTRYGGASALTVVRRERASRWMHGFGPRVGASFVDELPALERLPRAPVNLELALTPVTAVLEAIADGVTLTSAGYLPATVVVALDQRFEWSQTYQGKPPRGEADVPPLSFLRDHLREQRLLTRSGNKLTVSAAGQRLLQDRLRLWRVVVAPVPRWRAGFEHDALAVTALLLLRGDVSGLDGLGEETTGILAHKWRTSGEDSVEDGVRWVQLEWYRVGYVLGWWADNRRRLSLSPTGEAAAVSLLWAAAAQA